LQTLNILGIYRHPMFSNNAIEADRLILEESLAHLESISPFPLKIEMAEEAEAASLKGRYALVLTMAQSEDTLRTLEKVLPNSPIWNSPAAIRNCYRKAMSTTLSGLPVNYVPFQLLPTDGSVMPALEANASYWLKRSDFHAIADEDVTLAESAEEVTAKLARFRERGVSEVILQKHVQGDIYKFYGVKGGFFRPIRVRAMLEGATNPNFAQLEKAATRSAEALGLVIYGGDAILDSEGNFNLIDLNDWPSFRICRPDAAKAIAELSLAHLSRLESATRQTTASASCL
jgi:hypothetical protein